ncbi:substrate-binding periplasmic protein [Chitinimonas lacunae]|uniref:Substrate-binding periplasmic protein n=1 Tax=Chitinimonas lacunae TaxID=1963018 RepID=A0ABV8MWF9_9NEIS
MRAWIWIGLTLLALSARAERWIVAADNAFPPYSFLDPATQRPAGLDTDIVTATLQAIGQPFDLELYPWERVKKMLDAKMVDMAYQFVGTPERMAQYRLVGPIRFGVTVFMTRSEMDISYNELSDLAPYTIGTVHGFAYTDAFDKASYLRKDAGATSPAQLLQKLMVKRVDLIVGDKTQLLYLARQQGVIDRIKLLPKPLAEVARYVGFQRGDNDKADRFAQGLEKLRRDGTLERIISTWH